MAESKKLGDLPLWDNDPLSGEFFSQAQFNERAAALNYPKVFELLQAMNAAFVAANRAVEKDNNETLLVPRLLLIRARGAVLAAMRLAMAGEIPEAFPLLRLGVELAWYALHIAKDPSPPARAKTWLKRGDSKVDTQACKNEFKVANVRATHEAIDGKHAAHMQQIYENFIDLGAHPSQLGLFSATTSTTEGTQTTYSVGILNPTEFPLLATVAMTVGAGYDILRTFQLIFPERFEIMGLDLQIDQLLKTAQVIFKK
jgi:hypothetical protein